MQIKQITHTRKDWKKNITHVKTSDGYSYTSADAITKIKIREITFYIIVRGARVDVIVVGTPPNEYLRTTADSNLVNNLDNLPHF